MKIPAAIRALGLADVLVIGGAVALTSGIVQTYGWPVALMVLGVLGLLGGIGLAVRETRKVARR